MYKIQSVIGNVLTCFHQGYFPINFPEAPEINWNKIGVFKVGGISEKQKMLEKCKVHGKVLQVGNMLITCPINILRES